MQSIAEPQNPERLGDMTKLNSPHSSFNFAIGRQAYPHQFSNALLWEVLFQAMEPETPTQFLHRFTFSKNRNHIFYR